MFTLNCRSGKLYGQLFTMIQAGFKVMADLAASFGSILENEYVKNLGQRQGVQPASVRTTLRTGRVQRGRTLQNRRQPGRRDCDGSPKWNTSTPMASSALSWH